MRVLYSSSPIPPVPPDQEEKYSSAATLSDMEIFVFPELLYGLVLANLMSPRIWRWLEDPWFEGVHKLTPYRRVLRLKQFIIDHYEFNLDLDTWGLTTKERELARFNPWMDEATISQSNALFGYEGDKYYFDIDIRRHFGLDKYDGNVIPYWKTETVEAMDAFRYRAGFTRGAGECVSLSTLYAAALFIVCGVPLDDIFLMATPLHSQNFVILNEGIITNNRRLVTKNMWFNGTEQTAKAQRALRHERVTIVAHHTGYLHCVYPEATIDPSEYRRFSEALRAFLTTPITMEILANFLRDQSSLQKCFQIRYESHGKKRYIAAERVYAYEHNGPYKVSDATRDKLLAEIDEDEFFPEPLPDRLVLNDFEGVFKARPMDLSRNEDVERLAAALDCQCSRSKEVIRRLVQFAKLEPRLPDGGRSIRFVPSSPLGIRPGMTREHIIARLEELRPVNRSADLAFYAARDFARIHWLPPLRAAIERSPVSIAGSTGLSDREVAAKLASMPNESIYEGTRIAQPDEVWNYGRGDGFERLICLANILKFRHAGDELRLTVKPDVARLQGPGLDETLPSSKGLEGEILL
ncbi:MAG: hypothetical protein NZ740_09925 [Kiritimatiellae bacterium]|nr:hypothetical protein [Kiritimatiellia bacterium]MDW8459410.1 hypothetical protein [Verrucomicrobiota bacterium]